METQQVVVIDTGSYLTKAGPASGHLPSFVKETIVAQNGKEVWPVQYGGHISTAELAYLWLKCLEHMNVRPGDASVVLVVAVTIDREQLEQAVKTMFDKVGVSRLAVVTQAAAALYATGRTTGVVMGSGAGLNFVTPVYDGKADLDSSWTNRLAGNALTNFTDQLLRKQDHFLERKVVQEIKQKVCRVALNYEGQLQSISPYEVNYQLPNGTNLDSTEIRVTVPEGLFDTALLGKYDTGIAFLAHACISKSHRKEELYHNIVLAGGSTLFPGFGARLKQDVGGLLTQQVTIHEPDNREYLAWIGAAKMADSAFFQQNWATRSSYQQSGAAGVVNRWNLF